MIYFVRHGSTDWNDNYNDQGIKDAKCQGQADIPLNTKGITECNNLAKKLQGIHFDRVISSPLIRARNTCEIITQGKYNIELDDRLIERNFGIYEGLTKSQFDFQGFWNRNSPHVESTESIEDVEKRIYNLLDELKEIKDKNILLVGHGGVGAVILGYFNGIPKDGNYLVFKIPHAEPIIFDYK